MINITSDIYLGDRGAPFKDLITRFLQRGKLRPKYINTLTSVENMKLYGKAFTAASANPTENYEIYEQLGDLSANKFIVWYAYRRFPQLKCPKGVKVVARLRINYGAKQSFASIAESLGFWPYISAAEDGTERAAKYRGRHMKDLLEDVFEAIVGCTEQILDDEFRPGVGYAIVYDILGNIFDEIPISLKYTDLYDAKTRMKEIFDMFGNEIGTFKFIDTRTESRAISKLYQVPTGSPRNPLTTMHMGEKVMRPNRGWVPIGSGSGTKKMDAQQNASEEGIITLNTNGYIKPVALEYRLFCK